jgi:hypothetical protein
VEFDWKESPSSGESTANLPLIAGICGSHSLRMGWIIAPGSSLAAIDAHRAAEAAADSERRFDHGVPGETQNVGCMMVEEI